MLSLSTKGLENLVPDPSDDFTFIVAENEFVVNKSQAEFISPAVSSLRKLDKLTNSFVVDVANDDGTFNFIIDLMNGRDIEINQIQAQTLSIIAQKLGNCELYDKLIQIAPQTLTIENVIPSLISKFKVGVSYDKEIEYTALHFYEIEISMLYKLPVSLLELIFQSPSLKVECEDSLFDFIYSMIKFNGKEFMVLYEYIWFDCLDEKRISKFLKHTELTDMNQALWNSLSRRLLLKVTPESKGNDRYAQGTIAFDGENPFNGIVRSLKEETGENPHTNGLIKISYKGGNPYCDKLFDYDWKCYWSSTSCPDQWISFEFTKNYIYLTDYSLKSPNNKEGWNHLKNWVIEGSNDCKEWNIIDSRENNDDLNGPNKVATFHCKQPLRVRYLRLRQTGKNHHDAEDIQLTNVEFFGRLSEI